MSFVCYPRVGELNLLIYLHLKMIIICPTCGKKNRIPHQPRTDGVYRCGADGCKTFLFRHKVEFHGRLIADVENDLNSIKQELESIRFSVFRQRDIYFLKQKYDQCKARLQTWYDHSEFIRDKFERQQIYGTYRQELKQIEQNIKTIADLIDKKEEIKRIIRRFKPFVTTLGVLNKALQLAAAALSIIGLTVGEDAQFLLEEVQIFLIEGGLDESNT